MNFIAPDTILNPPATPAPILLTDSPKTPILNLAVSTALVSSVILNLVFSTEDCKNKSSVLESNSIFFLALASL